jgi:hypothetical protein
VLAVLSWRRKRMEMPARTSAPRVRSADWRKRRRRRDMGHFGFGISDCGFALPLVREVKV